MEKMDSRYVTEIFTAWLEHYQDGQFYFFILMEYCPDNLDNLIKQKARAFNREDSQPMSSLEFFISCELFKEMAECLQYLHSFEKSYLPETDMLREFQTFTLFI